MDKARARPLFRPLSVTRIRTPALPFTEMRTWEAPAWRASEAASAAAWYNAAASSAGSEAVAE